MTRQKEELTDENPDSKKTPQDSTTEGDENTENSEERPHENTSISETFDEEFEAAEIERLFGPVDDKHHDVEQV